MNIFRSGTPDGSLDKKFLRVCAVYRLLKNHRIGRVRALELLAERHCETEMRSLRGTVDLWKAHPIRDMLP